MTEEELQELIKNILNNSDLQSAKRRRNMRRLFYELERLPGLRKSSHPFYLEALNQTWEWVNRNICNFVPQPDLTIKESLLRWINSHLYWRIKDLYLNQGAQNLRESSLDVYIDNNLEGSSTKLDRLSETDFDIPTLSGIDSYIAKLHDRKIKEIFAKLEFYVQEDPEQVLQNCHLRKHPEGNCQTCCERLLFKTPPEKFSQISKQLDINYHALISHWKRKCLPLLQKKLKDLGYSEE